MVFHHIPKCGGTSLVRGLAFSYYPLRLLRHGKAGFSGGLDVGALRTACELFPVEGFAFRRQLLAYQMAHGENHLIYGHYPFSERIYRAFKDNWSFITVLRHPVDRWYSEYYYNRHKTQGAGKTTLDLESYLESDKGRLAARSFVNFLTEADDPVAVAGEPEALSALRALECFDVVGCLERLDEFLAAMQRRFGRRPLMLKFNRSPAKGRDQRHFDPDSQAHQNLLTLLAADIHIYEKTLARLD